MIHIGKIPRDLGCSLGQLDVEMSTAVQNAGASYSIRQNRAQDHLCRQSLNSWHERFNMNYLETVQHDGQLLFFL